MKKEENQKTKEETNNQTKEEKNRIEEKRKWHLFFEALVTGVDAEIP